MARGKKRNRSLFELMDSEGRYQVPTGMSKATAEKAEEAQDQETVPEQAGEEAQAQETRAEKASKRPVQKKVLSEEADEEYEIESLLTVSEGKIRLVLNYPLAMMICFMVVVVVICAVLVGWKLGRDHAIRNVLQQPIELRTSETELQE